LKDINMLLDRLYKWFENIDNAIIAYSGGVDSTLVAYLARQRLGADGCLAVISESSSLKRSDLKQAKLFCHHHDIPIKVIETGSLLI